MHTDTHPYRLYYPTGLRYRKAEATDLTLGNELAYDGLEDGHYWHGLVMGADTAVSAYNHPGESERRVLIDIVVALYNDETGEKHDVPLRYLTVPVWGERA